ncbi:MAG: hypothetical protein KF781_02565 [Chitinophagaceae bacterium]|nr:hypothetical protein [Chitinophagaceae bacterium]MCW5904393.1 hypothetical protein [Chitinophagaceae bacterium]
MYGPDVIFRTNKYWYHTVSANLGVEKQFLLSNNMQIVLDLNMSNYYTYSQYYRITYDYPTGPPNNKYTRKDNRYFGFSATSSVGLLKTYNKITIGPVIILPIHDIWQKDGIFPEAWNVAENLSSQRNKWFKGIGAGISFQYSLASKK